MKVLVTGGAGYVGSHTCKVLAEQGYTPVTIDNLVRGYKHAVQWGPLHRVDILDTAKVAEIIKSEKIDTVFHFAAYATVGESSKDPLLYYLNNVQGSLSLLQAMKMAGADKIIFSSTCATYGEPQSIPIDENAEQKPISPYGRTKLMTEFFLNDFVKAHQFSAVALRYFNAAGADLDCRIGEQHIPETHLIPLVLEAAMDSKKSISIFGQDYPTVDGTCVRDYIHVTDLGEAHVQALKYIEKNPGFEHFNLGTGQGNSVQQVIQTVEKITGKKINVKLADRRIGDPPVLISAGKKSQEMLKWLPRYSDLDKIVETAYQWQLKNK